MARLTLDGGGEASSAKIAWSAAHVDDGMDDDWQYQSSPTEFANWVPGLSELSGLSDGTLGGAALLGKGTAYEDQALASRAPGRPRSWSWASSAVVNLHGGGKIGQNGTIGKVRKRQAHLKKCAAESELCMNADAPDRPVCWPERALIATANIDSLARHDEEVLALDADIVALQEHHVTPQAETIQNWRTVWSARGYRLAIGTTDEKTAREGSGGVALLVKKWMRIHQCQDTELQKYVDMGRMLACDILRLDGKFMFHVVVLYGWSDRRAHQAESDEMFEALQQYVLAKGSDRVIVMGDFNCNVHEQWHMGSLMTEGKLHDAHENDMVWDHDHWARRPTHRAGGVLDHILVTPAVSCLVVDSQTQPEWAFPSHKVLQMIVRAKGEDLKVKVLCVLCLFLVMQE
mmetsp:Transcript_30312/g.66671  ORF Transcript_30312/g.66671 Transcript_30312/m.66671 type:complete len:403 (-) Transcript_30312:3247-4455(-)